MYKTLIIALFFFIILACEKENNTSGEPDIKVFTPTVDSLSWVYGQNVYNMKVNGVVRNFLVHVPNSYAHANDSIPILFMLHGTSGDGDRFYKISGWVEKADKERFIAVFPTAYAYPIKDKNGALSTKWNDANAIDDVEPGTVLQDDVAYVEWLVEQLHHTFNIDKKRRYIVGFSNGGGFVRDRILQEKPEIFAAAATGGGFGISEVKSVAGNRYLPLFCIIGSKDEKIIEASGVFEEIPLEGELFMSKIQLRPHLNAILSTLKLDTIYTEMRMPPGYNILTFNYPLSTQKNEYNLMIVNDLDHSFPNGKNNKFNVSGPEILWPWLLKWQY
jgi:polyhydroxybutyrate depolymerase